MPQFAAILTFQVVYRAKQAELATGERAQALSETIVAILRGSPKFKAVEIQCDSVGEREELDNDE